MILLLPHRFNFHLKRAEESPISNFSADLVNGVGYIHLLDQISPLSMDRTLLEEAAETTDPTARASLILAYASSMGCRRCITARDMVAGHQRLNLAFIAELFNHNVGIVLPSDEEVRELMNANELLRVENAALVERVHAYEMEVEALREDVAQRGVEVEETRRVMVEQREEAVRAGRDTSARIESEWRERAESLKTQYRQQTQALEQKHTADRATWHAETKLTADMLHDFLGRHGKATAMPGQLTGSHVRDMVMDVLALQDDKTREIHALEMKMKR